MPQVALGLSMHRPEMTPIISDHMRRHEAIFLEEASDVGFESMLVGSLAVDDYLMQLDVAYPTFSKNMCHLLQELKAQGKQIFQVEPFLKILLGIHEFFAEGHHPGELQSSFPWRTAAGFFRSCAEQVAQRRVKSSTAIWQR